MSVASCCQTDACLEPACHEWCHPLVCPILSALPLIPFLLQRSPTCPPTSRWAPTARPTPPAPSIKHTFSLCVFNLLQVTRVPADKLVDTNGAGDAFVGGFLSQLVSLLGA